MTSADLARVPVVAGLAYAERLRALPHTFSAALAVEPDNRYFLKAIAVLANGEKIGYVAPEIAADIYDRIAASGSSITCPARRGSSADHATSGVELLLDLSRVSPAATE